MAARKSQSRKKVTVNPRNRATDIIAPASNKTKESGTIKESKTRKIGLRSVYTTHPVITFMILLLLLSAVIGAGYIYRLPDTSTEEKERDVSVEIFNTNEPLLLNIQARVENGKSITIYSQTPGIVSSINAKEGNTVYPGTTLISLSQNYVGGNAVSLQRQIAEKQLQNTNDTFNTQLDLISKQREIAEKVDDNADELRSISEKSIGATESILDLNKDILETLMENLEYLEQNNTNGDNNETILTLKQGISQVKAGNVQLEASLRGLQYQSADDKPPAELTDRQRDVAILGLELQEKGLYLGRDIAEISVKAAKIAESVYFPQSPVKGTVEKIFVIKNQPIGAGMPLAVMSTSGNETQLTAMIPEIFQKLIKRGISAEIITDQGTELAEVNYVSNIPVQGSLYAVNFISESPDLTVSPGEFIVIQLTSVANCKEENICLIPVSSVTQSQNETSVLIAQDGVAVKKPIKTGDIAGEYIEVIDGKDQLDLIIKERNAIEGDKVSLK